MMFKLEEIRSVMRITFGILCATLGFTVLFGWLTNNIMLLQPSFLSVPMQYNTALAMLFSGISILCLKNKIKITIFFSAMIFLMSVLTITEYIFQINIGFDHLFIKHIVPYTAYPGRMPPNTAVCFLFVGLMFLFSVFAAGLKWANLTALSLCIIVGLLGSTSLMGYFLHAPMLYSWVNFTAMAPHTAAGLFGISLGCFPFMLNRFLKDHLERNYFLMIVVSSIGISLFLMSWQALMMHQNNLIKKSIARESIYGEASLNALLSNRFDAISRLFFRGQYDDNYKTDFWENDVNTYFTTYPTLQSVSAEDLTGKIYLYARDAHARTVAENNIHVCRQLLIQKNKNFSTTKKNIKLATNDQLLCIEDNLGKMVAVFDVKKLFTLVFNFPVWEPYGIELKNQGTVLFFKKQDGLKDSFRQQWSTSKQLSMLGQQWDLEIWPNEKFVREQTSLFPEFFLCFGLLTICFLVMLIYMRESTLLKTKLLERLNNELESFAYAAAHDLRAPLRVIDNASKWLEEDLQKHLTPETRENMKFLRGRVARMEKLLDDLLEYSLVGHKKNELHAEIISGDILITNILKQLSPPINFTVSVSPHFAMIQVARTPLQQILMHLIGNAIKHHDKKNGCIDITVEEYEQYYIFAVKDNGPGISEKYHDQIFKLFQTLKPKDQVESSGMGLAVVKKNVEMFGGTIYLESAEGQGSIFSVKWPK